MQDLLWSKDLRNPKLLVLKVQINKKRQKRTFLGNNKQQISVIPICRYLDVNTNIADIIIIRCKRHVLD